MFSVSNNRRHLSPVTNHQTRRRLHGVQRQQQSQQPERAKAQGQRPQSSGDNFVDD